MSKYTISILELIREYTADSTLPISKRIDLAIPKIFDFSYPIYEESHRKVLERKILMHYLNKEIGLETPDLWKIYLESRFNEIMPYYNELYRLQDEMLGIDFLHDTDLKINADHENTEKGKQENKLDTSNETNGKNSETDILSSVAKSSDNSTTDASGTTTDKNSTTTASENKVVGTETVNGSGGSTTVSENTDSGTSNTVSSSFPQGRLAGGNYADGSSDTTTSNTTTGNATTETTETKTTTDEKTTTESSTAQGQSDGTHTDKTTTASSSNSEQTNVRDNAQNTSSSSNGSQTGKEEYENSDSGTSNEKKYGLSGNRTVASMILEYRDSILNIDKMIIDDLADLFITIY